MVARRGVNAETAEEESEGGVSVSIVGVSGRQAYAAVRRTASEVVTRAVVDGYRLFGTNDAADRRVHFPRFTTEL